MAGHSRRASAVRRWWPPILRHRRDTPLLAANHSTLATRSRPPPFLWRRPGQSVGAESGVSRLAAARRVPFQAREGQSLPRWVCWGGGASLAAPAAVGRRARPAAATRLTGCPPPWCAGARLSCVGVLCRGFAQLFPIWSHRGSFRTAADVRTHLPACARPSASAVAWWGGGDRGGGLLLCQPVWWSCHRQSTAGVAVATLFSGCAFFF